MKTFESKFTNLFFLRFFRVTAKTLRDCFNVQKVFDEFSQKQNQIPGLICAVKEILNLPYVINEKTKELLIEILENMERICDLSGKNL